MEPEGHQQQWGQPQASHVGSVAGESLARMAMGGDTPNQGLNAAALVAERDQARAQRDAAVQAYSQQVHGWWAQERQKIQAKESELRAWGEQGHQLATEATARVEQYLGKDAVEAQQWRNVALDHRSRFVRPFLFAAGVGFTVPLVLWLVMGRAPAAPVVAS